MGRKSPKKGKPLEKKVLPLILFWPLFSGVNLKIFEMYEKNAREKKQNGR